MSTDFIRKVMASVSMERMCKNEKNMIFYGVFRPIFPKKKKEFETSEKHKNITFFDVIKVSMCHQRCKYCWRALYFCELIDLSSYKLRVKYLYHARGLKDL